MCLIISNDFNCYFYGCKVIYKIFEWGHLVVALVNVVTHFWVPAQKIIKIQKIKKILSKNITRKRGCQNTQKMVKNWLRRLKKTKIEIYQYFVD
jgi:hypothetical protein